ncbi:MAG TPA: BMP family ABC transporter substrate-binding protein [Gaiellaceae bacterium]|nr:BMP family ABC transporter substrate-binding protein [Gaiellaceae bacterium]
MVRIKWKWLLLAAMALVVALVAASCGGSDNNNSSSGNTTSTATGTGEKVALVSDTGGLDDKGFNQFSVAGFKRGVTDFGFQDRIYVSKTGDDYLPNLTAAAQDGNKFVIAVGYLLGPSVAQAADQFPDVKFAGVDQFFGGDGCKKAGTCTRPNVLGMVYPTEQSGYVAGVVAALMTKSKTVSTVGGKKIPSVDNWIAGFQQGVHDTKPGIKTLNAYSQDFEDLAKCKEIALDQISHGSDVVFQVAGKCGLGALDAACQKGKIGIGVDVDQSGQGKCVITSALKPLETSVYDMLKTLHSGQFKGGTNKFYGVQQLPDAQLLTPFQGSVPQSVKDAVAKAEQGLKDGSIKPPATLDKVTQS